MGKKCFQNKFPISVCNVSNTLIKSKKKKKEINEVKILQNFTT